MTIFTNLNNVLIINGNSDELEVDAEEAAAAAIGTRPMSEILGIVDSQLGIKPESDSADWVQRGFWLEAATIFLSVIVCS